MLFRSIRFCINYVLAFLASFFAMITLSVLGGLSSSISVLVVLPPLVASMVEAQVFVRHYGMRPPNKECWQASLRMTAMIVLMMLAVVIPMLILYPGSSAELAAVDATGRMAVYLLLCFITCCVLRTGYAIGLATELKGQQFPDN